MTIYGHLLTQDGADQLECVIGYATSLDLAMLGKCNLTTFELVCISIQYDQQQHLPRYSTYLPRGSKKDVLSIIVTENVSFSR